MSSDGCLLVVLITNTTKDRGEANREEDCEGDEHPKEREKARHASKLRTCVQAVPADAEADEERGRRDCGELGRGGSARWLRLGHGDHSICGGWR
jgi:hypothetical protein